MEGELNKKGWHLTPDGQEQCMENDDKHSVDSVIKKALNLDLRATGKKWLPVDVCSGRITGDYVEGPAVLQVLKLRNISAPKDNEESQAAPRLWKITLTDGQTNVAAVCLQPLKNLSLMTPPGTKLLLEGRVDIKNGYLLLSNKNARMLGGHVANLVESWQLKRKLAQQSRFGIQSEGGPPPFVPFGKKVSKAEAPRRDDFKSLAAGKQTEEEEDSEFQQQRQATIAEAEALTMKPKTFGGGQKSVKDSDLARIVEMGFTPDQASSALRQSSGNVNEAIGKLLEGRFDSRGEDNGQGRGRGGGGRGSAFRERGDKREQHEEGEKNVRRGGRRDGGRRGRGDDEEEDSVSSRPSGPATLFDFLETKIPSKSGKQEGVNKQRPPSSGQAQRFSSDVQVDQRPHTASGDSYSSQRTSVQNRGEGSSKPYYQRRDEREPQDRSQTSSYGNRSSDKGQKDSQNSKHKSDPANISSSGNRGKNYREDRTKHGVPDENQPKQKNQSSQQGDQLDRNDSSKPKSQRPSYSDRGDKQDQHLNASTQKAAGEMQRPGSKQSNPKFLREQNASLNSDFSGSHIGGSQSQSGHPESGPAGQRIQTSSGQKRNINQERHRGSGPFQPRWRRGQVVLAKYWEDNQLYRAVIEVVAENGYTAIVTFLDYGNQEEVFCADIHPLQPHANQNGNFSAVYPTQGHFQGSRHSNMPSSYLPVDDTGFDSNCIPKMEFRRGRSGPSYRQQEQGNRHRPTQSYYTPPNRKREG